MRRLIDEVGATDDALLGRLMRSVGPLPESEVSKRRVGRAVRERIASNAARAGRPSSLPRMRTVMAAAGLVLIGGIAGATVGRDAWERLFAATPAPAPVPGPGSGADLPAPSANGLAPFATGSAPAALAPGGAPLVPPAGSPTVTANLAPLPSVAPAPVETAHRPAPGEASRANRHAAATATTRATTSAPILTVEEMDSINALMARAQQVLRKDPAFARVAAEDYLRKAPGGMLVEDATYVACAAAFAEHDADASELAARYLTRYPSGQWAPTVRALVERTQTSPDAQR